MTAGTVFHQSKVPFPVWFLAIYLVAALTLARQLGLRYATAWRLHHNIRRRRRNAMAATNWVAPSNGMMPILVESAMDPANGDAVPTKIPP